MRVSLNKLPKVEDIELHIKELETFENKDDKKIKYKDYFLLLKLI